jgi:hypothetical protein
MTEAITPNTLPSQIPEVSPHPNYDVTAIEAAFATELVAALDQDTQLKNREQELWQTTDSLRDIVGTDKETDRKYEAAVTELSEVYRAEEKVGKIKNRRLWQLQGLENKEYPYVREYADEIDPTMYARYIPKHEGLGRAFNLPKADKPTTDPETARALLDSLPFVRKNEINGINPHKGVPIMEIIGRWDFPTERILSVESFEHGWTRNGGKSFTPLHLPDVPRNSLGAIVDYAQTKYDPPENDLNGGAAIMIFQDSDGEYWGMAHRDGSHRVTAAKLRGEVTTPVAAIEIFPDEHMPRVNFSVKERFGSV